MYVSLPVSVNIGNYVESNAFQSILIGWRLLIFNSTRKIIWCHYHMLLIPFGVKHYLVNTQANHCCQEFMSTDISHLWT